MLSHAAGNSSSSSSLTAKSWFIALHFHEHHIDEVWNTCLGMRAQPWAQRRRHFLTLESSSSICTFWGEEVGTKRSIISQRLLLQLIETIVSNDIGNFSQRGLLLELHDFLGFGELHSSVWTDADHLSALEHVGQTDSVVSLVQLVLRLQLFLLLCFLIN